VLKVLEVPASTGYGEPIQSLLNFQDGEHVITATLVTDELLATNGKAESPGEKKQQGELFPAGASKEAAPEAAPEAATVGPPHLLATAQGLGFRFRPNLEETTRKGRKVTRLTDDDEVVSVEPVGGGRVVCVSRAGKMLAFPAEDVSELNGPGRGVILMRMDDEDRMVGAVTTIPGRGITVTNTDGNEKDVALRDIPLGQRAGKGQRVIKRMTLTGVRGVAAGEKA
jgi:DNA gyrase/topoisomerase IV subunit A